MNYKDYVKEKLKSLQDGFTSLEHKKSEGIEQERKQFSNQVEASKKEIEQFTQKALTQIQEGKDKAMKELQYQYRPFKKIVEEYIEYKRIKNTP